MRPRPPQVLDEFHVRPRVLQGVSKDAKLVWVETARGKKPVLVCRFGQPPCRSAFALLPTGGRDRAKWEGAE